jgi:hypothetical protein
VAAIQALEYVSDLRLREPLPVQGTYQFVGFGLLAAQKG